MSDDDTHACQPSPKRMRLRSWRLEAQQLVAAQEQGSKGLAVAFEQNVGLAKDILGPGGMPPMPVAQHPTFAAGQKRYDLESEQAYPDT
jgi:hypothetical protein